MFADPLAYERFMGRHSRRLAEDFLDFAGLGADGVVLDAGSGTGALAEALATRHPGCQVIGLDPAPDYIRHAQQSCRLPNVKFETGDAMQLAHPDASFDAAVSLLVLNFIPRPELALAQLRRVLRPGGVLAAAVWDYGGGMEMLRMFWEAATDLDAAACAVDERRMPLSCAGELAALWQQAGLQSTVEQALEFDLQFDGFEDYWSPFLLGQGPAGQYVSGLAAGAVEALREELRRRLPSGPLSMRARAWAVRGLR